MQIMKKIFVNKNEVEEFVCNKCGREIQMLYGRPAEGVCHISQNWGYGSEKDGEQHTFDLCEHCYDEWVAEFAISVTTE